MKSQDILLLLKLASLEHQEGLVAGLVLKATLGIPDDWRGWQDDLLPPSAAPSLEDEAWTVRGLEESTGISKSQVSGALRRCVSVGLAHADRRNGRLRANTRALHGFVMAGLKYVFPAQRGSQARGIPTAYAAPVLAGRLFSSGEQVEIWEDPQGLLLGQRIEPLHPTVPYAVRKDAALYAMLALIDAIRLGRERESALAGEMLAGYLKVGA